MMRRSFQIDKPLYPLVSIAMAIVILCCGILVSSKTEVVYGYIVVLSLMYLTFGFGRVLWRALLLFLIVGLISSVLQLCRHQFDHALVTVARLLALALSSVPLITNPPILLSRCLNRLRVPRAVTLGMMVAVSFVPLLIQEIRRVRDAMRTRGVNSAWYSPGIVYRAFCLPFISQIIDMSDVLAISVETRGFDLTEKNATAYRTVSVKTRDILFALCVVAVSALSVVLWTMGEGRHLGI